MAGDVFGNGMLRSQATRLVAAFNHQHIFLDPTPDPEKSFAERARLFALPRSTWKDYDASVDQRRRRHLRAGREGDAAQRRRRARCSASRTRRRAARR